MRTCLVNLVELDPPRNGGMSRVAFVVANLLAAYAKQGKLDVVFAVGWQFADRFRAWVEQDGGTVIPCLADELPDFFKNYRPDLILSPLFGMFPFDLWEPYRGIPHIVSMPDALALDHPEQFSASQLEQRKAAYAQLPKAEKVVTLSAHAAQQLSHHLGLASDQLTVIPLAGDLPNSTLQDAKGGFQSPPQPYFFYPANGWPHKRHDLLMQAMSLVWESRPEYSLVLTGWQPEGYIAGLVEKYNCPSERVLTLGYVSNSAVIQLYQHAEALIFVSEHEGFGMPLLEAMQNDCPVICAPRTSIPEICADAALYVDSDDPKDWANVILNLLPAKRPELILKGQQRVSFFSWENTRAAWSHLIDSELARLPEGNTTRMVSQGEDLLVWASRYAEAQRMLLEKEQEIQNITQQAQQEIQNITQQAARQMAQQKKEAAEQAATILADGEERASRLIASLQMQETELLKKEKEIIYLVNIIESYRASFSYTFFYGPLTRYAFVRALFAWMRGVRDAAPNRLKAFYVGARDYAIDLAKKVRRFFLPRLGVPHQHEARPLQLPKAVICSSAVGFPSISIVTPSYNHANFIERTISSVLEQGYPNLEYVVIDGGSKDGTPNILEKYQENLAYFVSEPDSGQTNAINKGFAHTTGEIMAYLNSDDILLPGALCAVGKYFAEHPEVDAVYGHRIVINQNDQETGRWVMPPHDDEILRWADYLPQETLFWRRRLWDKIGGSFDENFHFAMDWDLLMRFVDAGAKFYRMPRFLGAFRVHETQKTTAQIADLGFKEMSILRRRAHGYVPEYPEIARKINPYMQRSLFYHYLYLCGILA